MLGRLNRAGDVTAPAACDAGGIIVGWLVRMAVVLSVVALLLFDGIAVGVTQLSVSDQGATAAGDAALTWTTTHSKLQAYKAAVESAETADANNVVDRKSFTVSPTGEVTFVMHRDATTLLLARWGRSRRWTHVTRLVHGHPPAA